jgi:hypothetical protein
MTNATDAIAYQGDAVFADWSENKKGCRIVFFVEEREGQHPFKSFPPGMHFELVAFCKDKNDYNTLVSADKAKEIGRGSLPGSAPSDGSDSGTATASDNAPSATGQGPNSPRTSLAQEAYRHTLKHGFMQWLNVASREAAEEKIEKACKVLSLSTLDTDEFAKTSWATMKAQFQASGFSRAS